jgi:hypothetical protein
MIYQSLSKKIPPIIGTLIRTISNIYYIIIGYHYQFSIIIITQNINHSPPNKQLLDHILALKHIKKTHGDHWGSPSQLGLLTDLRPAPDLSGAPGKRSYGT